jgi:hypothetical protein
MQAPHSRHHILNIYTKAFCISQEILLTGKSTVSLAPKNNQLVHAGLQNKKSQLRQQNNSDGYWPT